MKKKMPAGNQTESLILTLCPKCRANFENSGYVVTSEGWQKNKEQCDYCNVGMGFTYAVSNRKERL